MSTVLDVNNVFDAMFTTDKPLLATAIAANQPIVKPDKTDLHRAHATTITASNAHRIMADADKPGLSIGARSYIESMIRDLDNPEHYEFATASTLWGIENESAAIAAASADLVIDISDTGDNQRRFYYDKFISALPDGVVYDSIGDLVFVVEVKCLDTENHKQACTLVKQSQFKLAEPAKFAQIQVQMLCARCKVGFFVFYDPRYESQPLHILQISFDDEWIDLFLKKVELAHEYYLEVLAEDRKQAGFTENPEPAPDVKLLPRVNLDIDAVKTYHAEPEQLVEIVRQQAGNFVFDVTTSKGREACRSHATTIIRCISPALAASKQFAEDAKKIIKADLDFRKTFEAGIRQIAENTRRPLTEWEAEQERLAAWDEAIEIDILRDEAIKQEADRLAEEYQAAHALALEMNELFDLRREKAAREAKEAAESEAKARAEHEERLKQESAKAERERIERQQREAEEAAKREAERKEREAKEAIERAEREKQEAIEKAERDRVYAEQEAKRREETAIKAEQERARKQREEEEAEAERLRKLEELRAANRVHQSRVNNTILAALIDLGLTEETAKLIITAAAKKELGALVINY